MADARQTRVVAAAKSHIGEWKWSCAWFRSSEEGTFLPGEWKCNLFIAEMLGEGGFKVPLYNQAGTCASFALKQCSAETGRPPTASQWFNGEVPGTTLVGSGQQGLEKSWPGDILTNGSHIGIISGPQKTIHVSSSAAGFVAWAGVCEIAETNWGWLPGQWASMRVYRYHP